MSFCLLFKESLRLKPICCVSLSHSRNIACQNQIELKFVSLPSWFIVRSHLMFCSYERYSDDDTWWTFSVTVRKALWWCMTCTVDASRCARMIIMLFCCRMSCCAFGWTKHPHCTCFQNIQFAKLAYWSWRQSSGVTGENWEHWSFLVWVWF